MMNDEWIELSGTNEAGDVKKFVIRRDTALAVYEEYCVPGCLLSIAYGTDVKTVMLAGEYEIVRDEITGGKWSREAHRISQNPPLFSREVLKNFTDSFRFAEYNNAPSDVE